VPIVHSPSRALTTILRLTLFMAIGSASASAFTFDDQRRLCMGDAFRLCASEIPNIERITACMRRQRASLSEGCRSVFGKPTEQSASASER